MAIIKKKRRNGGQSENGIKAGAKETKAAIKSGGRRGGSGIIAENGIANNIWHGEIMKSSEYRRKENISEAASGGISMA
jgi:hypothetical protein